MAPELALAALKRAPKGAAVLDPMCGSGTVLQQAREQGMLAFGYDIDPLAVLVTRVTCTRTDPAYVQRAASKLVDEAKSICAPELPWMDADSTTSEFVDFWFHSRQQKQLRRLAYLLYERSGKIADVLRVALSRTIITKDAGASRARDVSHSRPHRVRDTNTYDVYRGFLQAVDKIVPLLDTPDQGAVSVERRDARRLPPSLRGRIDLAITSPPYLNAIDYMRGHRMSLVWLGYQIKQLSELRSNSVGAERYPEKGTDDLSAPRYEGLSERQQGMLDRYAGDADGLMAQLADALSPQGEAVLVVGDSTLNGVLVHNSEIIQKAAEHNGFFLADKQVRPLPTGSRYLPPPASTKSALARRMREEVVMRFTRETVHQEA
jgi:DNA modification methylase